MAARIASCDLVTDALYRLLDTDTDTYLIVCATKAEFLVQLAAAIRGQRAHPASAGGPDLLTNTIGLLAKSSKIRLIFCPSLESLRAYLAVLSPAERVAPGDAADPRRRFLAVLDIVALHANTSEFSAQGLSRTLAATVEAASRAEMDLTLYECTNALDPSTDRGRGLWDVQVPLLNGSVRMRDDGSAWGGRGASVKRIAQRWFEFDQDSSVEKARP
ncbi:hypothetical protein NUU61_007805 [Penicillium alfredii]|uniref:Uncharacterized protein n=1 Tax=Penicillium alfredii TaxID=1506179 RepID=A0A9W9ER66_9EURO|nr:uncharacterized protein NUU61_007805 [Penicillium alfredii]KAJ5086498.1 hypothetical protein NUU61_007805 [Penicillium alfredii]